MSDQISPTADSFKWLDLWERTRDPSHFRQRTIDEWRILLAEAGFRWIEHQIVPYRLEFDWWVKTAGADPHVIATLENHAASANAATRASLGIEYDQAGRVEAFHEPMMVVRMELMVNGL
jgi:hypothetical protein